MCSLIPVNIKTYRLQLKLSTATRFFHKMFHYVQAQFWRDTSKKKVQVELGTGLYEAFLW